MPRRTERQEPERTSYQVVLPGRFGPALLNTFKSLGVGQVATTSAFLLRADDDLKISDIAAMLQEHGLLVLGIRRVDRHPPLFIPEG